MEINGIKYQKSLKNTGAINNNFDDYLEILEYFKTLNNINFDVRFQSQFNQEPYIYPIVHKIIQNEKELATIMDPKYKKLRIRVACPDCGLADKNSINTKFDNDDIISYCPNHGVYVTNITKESYKLEYNTPIRNLVRAMAYGLNNIDKNKDYQIMRITGSDYAGFYQEELLYKPASILNYPVYTLPSILYTPLILDWSDAKISKSLYVKEGAYNDLPPYLINYDKMKTNYGIKGLNLINEITDKWIDKPYLLFRNYSIYYFKKEFEDYEKRDFFKHKTGVH
ncbi:MAG: hypothetical protein IKE75_01915 [Bacilli bacterium]|nr:hypothetical protein [Bacilli bacterium]